MRSVLKLGLVSLVALAFVGCAKPPEAELTAAQDALDNAQKAGAETYAPSAYQTAKDTMAAARSEVAQQQGKFFKNFDNAKASAIHAKDLADQAQSQAETEKEKTKNEAQALVDQVSSGLTDARTALGKAPRGKGADSDLDQIQSDLSQVENTLKDAQSNLSSGKYKDALSQAQSAKTKLDPIQTAMQTAQQKVEAWKAKRRWYLHVK